MGYINNIVAIWRENMLGYLSADLICSKKRTVFRERSSRKTVSYEEQIMSKDKYATIFSPQMACLYYPSNLFRNARSFENWGIFNNYSPKWRWLAVDIYRAAKRRGKYPPLATSTSVNSSRLGKYPPLATSTSVNSC